MQTLAKHDILSAPILISPDLEDLGELREEPPRPQLLGWVDVNDIVREYVKSAILGLQRGMWDGQMLSDSLRRQCCKFEDGMAQM
jgi:hypothetical protein